MTPFEYGVNQFLCLISSLLALNLIQAGSSLCHLACPRPLYPFYHLLSPDEIKWRCIPGSPSTYVVMGSKVTLKFYSHGGGSLGTRLVELYCLHFPIFLPILKTFTYGHSTEEKHTLFMMPTVVSIEQPKPKRGRHINLL